MEADGDVLVLLATGDAVAVGGGVGCLQLLEVDGALLGGSAQVDGGFCAFQHPQPHLVHTSLDALARGVGA